MKKILLLLELVLCCTLSYAQEVNLGPTGSQVQGTLPLLNGGLGQNASLVASHYVFIGPATGSSGPPTFRELTAADIPALNILLGLTAGMVQSDNSSNLTSHIYNGFVFGSPAGTFAAATASNFNSFFTSNISGCNTTDAWYSPKDGTCFGQKWPSGSNAGIPSYNGFSAWNPVYNSGNTIPANFLPAAIAYQNNVNNWSLNQIFNGPITFTNLTGLVYANGSSPLTVASASQIVTAIGTTPVTNANYVPFSGITAGTNSAAGNLIVGAGTALYPTGGSITASALNLASTPSVCSAGHFSTGIDTLGNAICTVFNSTAGGWTSGNNSNGYWEQDPAGLYKQWGIYLTTLDSGCDTLTFPISFTNLASISVEITTYSNTDRISYIYYDPVYTDDNMTISSFNVCNNGSHGYITWQAVGY